jgi:hypothetical protein
MDYGTFKVLLQEVLDEMVREQEHMVALVASRPGSTLDDIKLEVGKLYGIGDSTVRIDAAVKNYFSGEDM